MLYFERLRKIPPYILAAVKSISLKTQTAVYGSTSGCDLRGMTRGMTKGVAAALQSPHELRAEEGWVALFDDLLQRSDHFFFVLRQRAAHREVVRGVHLTEETAGKIGVFNDGQQFLQRLKGRDQFKLAGFGVSVHGGARY